MKDKWKVAKKIWHERNKERRYKEYKKYRKENILKMRARDQRRIALEKGARGILTDVIIKTVYLRNKTRFGRLTCYLCLKPVPLGKENLEHKTPLSRGGTNYLRNLDVSCKPCNMSKKNKTYREYKKYAGLLSVISN